MIIVTIISSIQLGVDNPLNDPENLFPKVILIIDYVLTTIFAIEAILKIIANGLALSGVRSYFRDVTNILDFFLVIITVSILNLISCIDCVLFSKKQSELNQGFEADQTSATPESPPSEWESEESSLNFVDSAHWNISCSHNTRSLPLHHRDNLCQLF